MIFGIPLLVLQVYLLAGAAKVGRLGHDIVGTVGFVLAAIVLVVEIGLMVRFRNPEQRWRAYPIGFIGLVVVGLLLLPLLIGVPPA